MIFKKICNMCLQHILTYDGYKEDFGVFNKGDL